MKTSKVDNLTRKNKRSYNSVMKKSDSRKRLLELTKYIITRADDDVFLGSVKLNKILFLGDFLYYRERGVSITGQNYVHAKLGPIPEEMSYIKKHYEGKQFTTVLAESGPYTQKRLAALKNPNLNIFSADMISFIDKIIEVVCSKTRITGTYISEYSHDYLGWLNTKMGEKIPYGTIFLEIKSKQVANLLDEIRTQQLIDRFDGRYGIDKRTQKNVIQIAPSNA